MLKEKHLLACSLLFSAFGIALLFCTNAMFEPVQQQISEINGESVGQSVLIKGVVKWAMQKDGFVLFELHDGKTITAIKFSPSEQERQAATKGNFVEVIGKVQVYRNELEIVAQEIRKWQ